MRRERQDEPIFMKGTGVCLQTSHATSNKIGFSLCSEIMCNMFSPGCVHVREWAAEGECSRSLSALDDILIK